MAMGLVRTPTADLILPAVDVAAVVSEPATAPNGNSGLSDQIK
jgi:hypothetical protein